jgi:hypothetical protein
VSRGYILPARRRWPTGGCGRPARNHVAGWLGGRSYIRLHSHILDPSRPRAPPCGQSCRLTRPPTLLARTPRRHSSLHGAAALHHTTSHSSLDATQPPQCPFSGPYTIGPPVLLLLLLLQQLRCYSNFENDNLRFSSGLFSTPAVCVLRTT